METIAELHKRHTGRPAVIVGGGPSVVEQIARTPKKAVYISANQHGLLLRSCDYVVFCDVGIGEIVQRWRVPKICEFRQLADYWYDPQSDVWDAGFTSGVATWMALFMDCDPVILTGMDCFNDHSRVYWHTHKAESSGTWSHLDRHLHAWELAHQHCPLDGRIKAAGGPLVEHGIFPEWKPLEQVA